PPPPPPPPTPEPAAPVPKADLGVEGILQGSLEEMPELPRRSEALSRAVEAPPGALDPREPGRATPDPQNAPVQHGPPSGPRRGVASGVDELLTRLEQGANLPSAGDTLVLLGEKMEAAVKAKRQEEALRIVAGVVRAERTLTDAGPRRQYGIALKRMYTKALFTILVELLDAPRYEADAELALQRGGGDAVEILLERLAESPTVAERRRAFDVLAKMKEAGSQLINMMGHPQWFVVRNVAELIGEMGLDEAVPALTKKIDHDDVRVRKAVALALAKIGTRSVVEPLRRALRDPLPEVRTQAALGVGGRRANALAMPLVVALDEEKDLEVSRELILALGRIGSPDAVQALIKLAQTSGGFFNKRPLGLRLAAIEALRLAATPAALGVLQGLLNDSDKQIKAAAQAAAQEIKARP
ncbi:MAG TPA: HEAT repeat domain-containing protein, partial [Gemmatimonadales bacterium]|nr:HEAT repeat domain-containing protein [Gemmatimonadales bacterium]